MNRITGKTAAIVLAAGSGKRMNSTIKKQFIEVNGFPIVYYSIKALESYGIDRIILVTSEFDLSYCKTEIVEKYGLHVEAVIPGGKERYHSVYEGLKYLENSNIVIIQDGARPCLDIEIIDRVVKGATSHEACIVGMPVKDTIKLTDHNGFALQTPNRDCLWAIQTPQAFSYSLIYKAYQTMFEIEDEEINVTDDAMVVERYTNNKVKIVEGSYRNIKVTTPDDLFLVEHYLK